MCLWAESKRTWRQNNFIRPIKISAVMTRDGTGQAALFWKVSKGNLLCQVIGFFIAYNAYVRFDFDEVNGIWAVDYAISNDLKKVLMQVQGYVRYWMANLMRRSCIACLMKSSGV